MAEDSMLISELTLEKFKLAVTTRLSKELLADCKVDISDIVGNDIVACVHLGIYGQQLDKVEVKYPSDWWQALKERWLPRRMLSRYPVSYTVKTVDVRALYPTLVLPGHTPIINVLQRSSILV